MSLLLLLLRCCCCCCCCFCCCCCCCCSHLLQLSTPSLLLLLESRESPQTCLQRAERRAERRAAALRSCAPTRHRHHCSGLILGDQKEPTTWSETLQTTGLTARRRCLPQLQESLVVAVAPARIWHCHLPDQQTIVVRRVSVTEDYCIPTTGKKGLLRGTTRVSTQPRLLY